MGEKPQDAVAAVERVRLRVRAATWETIDCQIQARFLEEVFVHVFAHRHRLQDADGTGRARLFAIAAPEARFLVHHNLAIGGACLQRILRADGLHTSIATNALLVVDGRREARRRETVADIARCGLAQVHGQAAARAATADFYHVARLVVVQSPHEMLDFYPERHAGKSSFGRFVHTGKRLFLGELVGYTMLDDNLATLAQKQAAQIVRVMFAAV